MVTDFLVDVAFCAVKMIAGVTLGIVMCLFVSHVVGSFPTWLGEKIDECLDKTPLSYNAKFVILAVAMLVVYTSGFLLLMTLLFYVWVAVQP